MPVALLLGIKREAIGATFSIGREPGLAIVGERFGMDSPEGRGVLAEYITGTLFGAIFISILAGFVTSLNIFHPLALAMGAGMGSGSMTAAAVGAIAAQQTPEVAKDVAAFAAAANLIATTIGTYLTLFISLPLAVRAYRFLEPILGRNRKGESVVEEASSGSREEAGHAVELNFGMRILSWLFVGLMVLIGNRIGFGTSMLEALPGVALIILAVLVGDLIYMGTRRKLPAVCWISFVAMAMTFPSVPYAAEVAELTGKVSFLALITPLLSFAGLSLAKDIPAFRRLGWRIVVVSLPVSDIVEQVVLGKDGLLQHARAGQIVLDTSTADPASTARIAQALKGSSLRFVDGPVSGGPKAANSGSMTMLLGGEAADIDELAPVLDALTGKRVHVGPVGAGHSAKLFNNLLCGINLIAAGEAIRVAKAAGLDIEQILSGVNAGSGRSGVTEVNCPTWILNGAFNSGFTMKLMRKDLRLAAAMIAQSGANAPLSQEALRLWADSADAIEDGEDFNRIVDYDARS
ncbi:3-hydroxyisobutyrate dehydrogenase-like beta-hydroxyacid dehydrogenase [Paracandidimonas soli]|uniref:3-hydroxyisobutyrate dehydrogenase-like beta-hydroxyacid dehydrogenase n=1 Tax=Paracandidimonas soli TaxID=1917182 RepID=A0A4R3UVS5_9BURK|nr:3-hydroxyisobutyrate dehydrogenase-like beta-hydroxyacid dehydrogenase [Paracandidimonas soli]